jgi:hypothetical protein
MTDSVKTAGEFWPVWAKEKFGDYPGCEAPPDWCIQFADAFLAFANQRGVSQEVLCAARHSDTGANDPQDCGWPFCGCDPKADAVISAIEESGFQIVKQSSGGVTQEQAERAAKAIAAHPHIDVSELMIHDMADIIQRELGGEE